MKNFLKKDGIRLNQKIMANAEHYQTWHDAARQLDKLEGNENWKHVEATEEYDWQFIKNQVHVIRNLRESRQFLDLIYHLRGALHQNIGNISNPKLYTHTRTGTKYLIDEYITEVVTSLNALLNEEIDGFSVHDKLEFFEETSTSYGRAALLLSGGAGLGFFHLGLVKTLLEHSLLPRVISGSSAGSIIASIVGCYSDKGLHSTFDPDNYEIRIWKWLSLKDIWREKHLINSQLLWDTIRQFVGEKTFEEAYDKTGRSINITISPEKENQIPRLLNHLTTPHLYIWNSVLASCAVPGLFPPVPLTSKDRLGSSVAYMPSQLWVDGSLKGDLPMRRLSRLYNVNRFITSQANPYVLPFLTDRAKWNKWGNDTISLVNSELKLMGRYALDWVGSHSKSGLLHMTMDNAIYLLTQSYWGDITIHPSSSLANYRRALTDPSKDDIRAMILEGEQATWPKLSIMRNQTLIGHTLDYCVLKAKKLQDHQKKEQAQSPE
ncbi:MAG: DUF3336 domain-containing protein [SAR324 cluster bacterium]|nr:DUF3336 domain-containing protein [SAR324 cluster bacterium]